VSGFPAESDANVFSGCSEFPSLPLTFNMACSLRSGNEVMKEAGAGLETDLGTLQPPVLLVDMGRSDWTPENEKRNKLD
jgi:hypothetical protein